MTNSTKGAALALALACTLGGCSREDEADKQAVTMKDSAAVTTQGPVTTQLAVWDVRFDDAGGDGGGYQMNEQPGGGWAMKTGSAGSVTWRDQDMVDGGPFQLTATFSAPSSTGGDGYGVFVGGRHLADPDRAYTAFLVRPDGAFRIERREAGSNPTYADWTPMPALKTAAHGGETADNTLEVRVEALATHFLINGTEVKALPNDQAQPFGTAGLRVAKGSDLIVKGFEMNGRGSGDAAGAPVLRSPPDSQPSLPR